MTNDRILELYRRTFPAGPYVFTTGVIQFARAIAEEARREASTEPSAKPAAWMVPISGVYEYFATHADAKRERGEYEREMADDPDLEHVEPVPLYAGAGALTDEAKDAALETMDHDQLGKLGQHYTNKK